MDQSPLADGRSLFFCHLLKLKRTTRRTESRSDAMAAVKFGKAVKRIRDAETRTRELRGKETGFYALQYTPPLMMI
jgi:hypothetical protein